MNRKVLLIEPNYKNKYPPMGLMKLATYFRKCGDDVRFFKGNLKEFSAKLLCEEFLQEIGENNWERYTNKLVEHIKTGKFSPIDGIPNFRGSEDEDILKKYRIHYRNENFTKFDFVGVTTLFTFYWKETIETINYAKKLCKSPEENLMIGGIASTILPNEIERKTGIKPYLNAQKGGLLDTAGVIDKDNPDIIDELPLDYSILDEIDYKYPASNAYFAYMTRGCPRNCSFCAVSQLEPKYKNYIGLQEQITIAEKRFGAKKDLLLMDNNVFASDCFDTIIDEIKACGFERGATYLPVSEYEIAIENLRGNDNENQPYNERAYKKKMVELYDKISEKLPEDKQGEFYLKRENLNLLYAETASISSIFEFDDVARPLHEKHFKRLKRSRYIDFNQGVDARLVSEQKMKKLSEINIRPLRIAFDHYSQRDVYEKAIRLAVKYGIKDLSNYLLYNFDDTPEELYYRMRINIDLCEEPELGVNIYSFPMKYQPISDSEFYWNRDYIGKHWNRKFIRAIQAVLNSTKGKIGRGKKFFEEAFGKDIEGFHKILLMPEAFIIHRFKYKDNLTAEWWNKFCALSETQREALKKIVAKNIFDDNIKTGDVIVDEVLDYYRVKRDSH